MEFNEFLDLMDLKTKGQGQYLWCWCCNADVFCDGDLVQDGSWRWNAGMIAARTGGDYMDYYMACGKWSEITDEDEAYVEKKFDELNVVIIDSEYLGVWP